MSFADPWGTVIRVHTYSQILPTFTEIIGDLRDGFWVAYEILNSFPYNN